MQAENPKQQYLLLRALNEVITSLTANTSLPDRQQDEVSFTCLCVIGMAACILTPSLLHGMVVGAHEPWSWQGNGASQH